MFAGSYDISYPRVLVQLGTLVAPPSSSTPRGTSSPRPPLSPKVTGPLSLIAVAPIPRQRRMKIQHRERFVHGPDCQVASAAHDSLGDVFARSAGSVGVRGRRSWPWVRASCFRDPGWAGSLGGRGCECSACARAFAGPHRWAELPPRASHQWRSPGIVCVRARDRLVAWVARAPARAGSGTGRGGRWSRSRAVRGGECRLVGPSAGCTWTGSARLRSSAACSCGSGG